METCPLCSCGADQMIRHLVEECPNIKFEGGVGKLYEAETEAIKWIIDLDLLL